MHPDQGIPSSPETGGDLPWWRELTQYHWFVLIVAALGWLFDTMDQQLFVLARTPALTDLLGSGTDPATITRMGGLATTIFILGWATGGLVFGLFGDRWGRARTMMVTILIYSLFTGLSAASVSFYDFAFYRFITGMGVGGEFAAGVSLVAEAMPTRARPYALGLLQALSAVGNMMAAGISFLLPPQIELQGVAGWRWMFLVGIAPAMLVIVVRRRLKEPESWVKAKLQLAAAAATIPSADDESVQPPETMRRGESVQSGEAMQQTPPKDELHRQMGDLRELFGDPRWRYHTIIGVTLAMAGVMSLWGVGFWTPELVRNNVLKGEAPRVQDNYASLTSLLQNFGAFFGIYAFSLLTGMVGRRIAFAIAIFLGLSATIMVFGFMTEKEQIWWMIPILGFCTLMIFGGYAIYFPELFPTRLRSTGTGFCYNVARYLAAVSPFILGHLAGAFRAAEGTDRYEAGLSSLTFLSSVGSVDSAFRYAALTVAMIYLLGLVVLPFAPETKGKPLPE
jgi:MFS family permease